MVASWEPAGDWLGTGTEPAGKQLDGNRGAEQCWDQQVTSWKPAGDQLVPSLIPASVVRPSAFPADTPARSQMAHCSSPAGAHLGERLTQTHCLVPDTSSVMFNGRVTWGAAQCHVAPEAAAHNLHRIRKGLIVDLGALRTERPSQPAGCCGLTSGHRWVRRSSRGDF